MTKFELLKQKIVEVCKNEAHHRNIYRTDDYMFIIGADSISTIYEYDYEYEMFPSYYVPDFTDEERKEVQRIKNKLNLNDLIYLPIVSDAFPSDLETLIEYYEGDERSDAKIEEINRLTEELNCPDCLFYQNEERFLEVYLYSGLETGIAYVHSEWDHDAAYYLGLSFRTGVWDTLYDMIDSETSLLLPDDLESSDSEECDFWIHILSNLDQYVIIKNQ